MCSDISIARLDEIERALTKPAKQGLTELFQLKADTRVARSSLEPEGGLAALTDAPLLQQDVPMEARRELRDLGEWLRGTEAFRSLSSAEASTLATILEHRTAAAGDVLVRRGDADDDLYLIESGHAEVRSPGASGPTVVATLGPGNHFGEIALLGGGERTADVSATRSWSPASRRPSSLRTCRRSIPPGRST